MPSQNLPKPNIPGQKPTATPVLPVKQTDDNQTTKPSQLGSATVFQKDSSSPQPTTPKPLTLQPPQLGTPGMLSRENPAGAPPKRPALQTDKPLTTPQAAPQTIASKPNLPNISTPSNLTPPKSEPGLDKKPAVPILSKQTPSPQFPGLTPTLNKETNQTKETAPTVAPPVEKEAKKANKKAGFLSKLPIPKGLLIALGAVILIGLLASLASSLGLIGGAKKNDATSPSASSTAGDNVANTGEATNITYWGLWEDSQILNEVFNDFEAKYNIKVDYRKQSHRDYRERLQQAIASGNGPDVFRFHATWVPMLSAELAAMPSSVMSSSDYQSNFYPSAFKQLQLNGQIVGVPLMYDGLALLYNKEMLKTANLSVPSTWADLRTAANKLTVPSNPGDRQPGNITRGGLAIGNAGNVDHFSDILGLLILQNGGSPADPSTQYVKDALTFYTNFVKQDMIWSDRLPNSSVAFARGEAAMIFAPSWRIHEIKNLNPNLDFGVAPVPQLSAEQTIAWSSFWAEGVNKKSKKQQAAWQLVSYLSSMEVLQEFYSAASLVRPFGEIYPRTDMASSLKSDDLVGAYLEDAPYAKSWYLASFTHDNGLNDQLIQYYSDAVNSFLTGGNSDEGIKTLIKGVDEVLGKYNLN